MKRIGRLAVQCLAAICGSAGAAEAPLTLSEIVAASSPSDWRPVAPEDTLLLELPTGRVIIELATGFAPRHIANIKTLAREKYFDGLVVIRVQDNFVAQWGSVDGKQPPAGARNTLPAHGRSRARE